MKKIYKYTRSYFIILFYLFFLNSNGQKYVSLKFELDGKRFDSLRISTTDTTNNLIVFYGKTTDQVNWSFELPYYIWDRLDRIVLGNANEKLKIKKYEYINFLYETSQDKEHKLSYIINDVPCYVPDWSDVKVQANYINSDTVFVDEDDVELIYHNFSTKLVPLSGIEAWTKCPDFSSFSDMDSNDLYTTKLRKYQDLVKQYPDSRLLLLTFGKNINRYRSEFDAKSIFNLFSLRNKESFIGNKISKQFSNDWTKFDNLYLKNIQNGKYEKIVTDSSKFTLISFTASWCVYCKQEIPVLKQIYSELKNESFEMVYIDLDAKNTIPQFIKQTVQDSIPWRTLISYPQQDELQKKYANNGIPVNMLISPDGTLENLDVREIATQKRLIKMVKNYHNVELINRENN